MFIGGGQGVAAHLGRGEMVCRSESLRFDRVRPLGWRFYRHRSRPERRAPRIGCHDKRIGVKVVMVSFGERYENTG